VTAERSDFVALRACLWCLVFVAVEVGLYLSYRGHDARFHWSTHFLVGASTALVFMAVAAWRRKQPVPAPLLWLLAAHLFAMFPDFVFTVGDVHRRWMDVFLGHIATHFVPGRNWTWYAVFLGTLGVYLVTVDRVTRRQPA